MKKAELITLLQNNLQPKGSRPPPQMSTWEPIDDRPIQNVMSSSQDMDIFEQQGMGKNRPQVTSKLNDWLVNHVPKPIKDKASRVFKTFKVHMHRNF